VEERENYLKNKEFLIYCATRFYSPGGEISWYFMKRLKKGSLNSAKNKADQLTG